MNHDDALKKSEAGLLELQDALRKGKSDKLLQYLEMVSKFHQYSFGNCMMISLQMPNATHVAGFRRWKQLGRWVKKGERGLAIFAPMVGKRKTEDPATTEEDKAKRVVFGFRVVHVYDVSQTEGKDLPKFAELGGEPGELQTRLEAMIASLGIGFDYVGDLGSANGVSLDGRIEVVDSLPSAQKFSTSVHELAHELLHRGDRREQTTTTIRETEAEAVAYAVCRWAGIDCSTRASDYIQLYSGNEKVLSQSLELIRDVAARIIETLDNAPEICESKTEVSHASS